jgi:oxygen-independent coproporphyrinogen-3 oxidase
VKKGGFDNINVDLMSALPGSDISSWSETLKTVADMDVKHISAYSLIIEDGTPFGEIYGENNAGRKKPGYPDLPDEETEREMYHITNDHLSSHGFFQYEISNYAKSGFECRHNKVYWQGGYYIGAGLSAAGHLPAECFDRSGVRSFRYKNTSDITEYLELKPENILETFKEFEPVTDTDAARELFIFGLRMNEGVDVKKAMGVVRDPEFAREIQRNIDELQAEGLVETDGKRLRLSEKGRDLENYVVSFFI